MRHCTSVSRWSAEYCCKGHILPFKKSITFPKYVRNSHLRPGNEQQNSTELSKMSSYPSVYEPAEVESGVYDWWEKEGFFKPKEVSSKDETFSMVLPPPNVTGMLHLGHALTVTVQDVLARWHRMHGKSVCWVPGMDHAGIATQVAVEKKLWHEKKLTRHDIGRQEFEKEVWKWKEEKAGAITQQLRKLGASLDWSRNTFTMDPVQQAAVEEAFIRLFEDGLIYRAKSLVNWSCTLQSAISDIEVNFQEVKGRTMLHIPGYHFPVEFGVLTEFAYKLVNSDEEIVVSTTRLETVFGDVAVAVHPLDKRYKKWHGASVWHPFREEPIPVICDEFVDPDFGTGAVKITPAHSFVDHEVAKRHNLQIIPVISEEGKLTEICGKYSRLRRFDARRYVLNELTRRNLLRGEQEHFTTVPVCSRSGDIVEFLLKSQWFVDCQVLGKQAAQFVRNGDLEIIPDTFKETWFNWLDNIKDWCISRQLWWGHRIPAYQCHSRINPDKTVWVAARSIEEACGKAAPLLGLERNQTDCIVTSQDSDVLDTWFSSALFPFSVHGWPNQGENMTKFYPLSLMETGHDILFFWVARMVMLGAYCTGTLPFKKVMLHGIICDASGRKMSKSLGNVIDPGDVIHGISTEDLAKKVHKSFEAGLLSELELAKAVAGQRKLLPEGIQRCGTDALRFTLCSQNITNFFINFDVRVCAVNSAFCNKIWQACRYVHQCLERHEVSSDKLSKMDCWILSRLAHMVAEVDTAMQNMEFHFATAAIKTFLYEEFCNIYLETTKPVVKSDAPEAGAACWTLLQCFLTSLQALSPFMPYISEELYQRCVKLMDREQQVTSVMVTPYPKPEEWAEYRNENVEKELELVNSVVHVIRQLRSTYNIDSKTPEVHIIPNTVEDGEMLKQYIGVISTLSYCGNINIVHEVPSSIVQTSVVGTTEFNCVVHVTVKVKNEKKVTKEILRKQGTLNKELAKLLKITTQPGYRTGAPKEVQDTHFRRIEALEAELQKLKEYQASLKS